MQFLRLRITIVAKKIRIKNMLLNYLEGDSRLVDYNDECCNFYHSYQSLPDRDYIIDVAGIMQFLTHFFMFGERTLIHKVKRIPWNSDFHDSREKWIPRTFSIDKRTFLDFSDYSSFFIKNVQQELIDVTKGKKEIGLLLSGGMDSRIVAVLLNDLIKKGLINCNVKTITWGKDSSRDVNYARRISDLYKWNLIELPLTSEILSKNIYVSAQFGCEFSPVHVHAIPEISSLENIDLVLVGSYGDSMGRGEYSGTIASKLKPISNNFRDYFGFINSKIKPGLEKDIMGDLQFYRQHFHYLKKTQLTELEYLIHYMRRELNPVFRTIENISVHQVFTNRELVAVTLGMPYEYRGNRLYYEVIKQLNKNLLSIPWARTGLEYYTNHGSKDSFSKDFHEYGKWIKNELFTEISDLINNGILENLQIFNLKNINSLIKWNSKYNFQKSSNRIEEIIIWLASLSVFVEKKNITNPNKILINTSINDFSSKLFGLCYSLLSPLK